MVKKDALLKRAKHLRKKRKKDRKKTTTHHWSTGRLRVIEPRTSSPYLRYPKNPTAMYKQVTITIDVFSTPFQPIKARGVLIWNHKNTKYRGDLNSGPLKYYILRPYVTIMSWPLEWSRGRFSLKVANPQYFQNTPPLIQFRKEIRSHPLNQNPSHD